jgi:hypothetical protein
VSDIDTAVVVDGLKALDPKWPIREADIASGLRPNRFMSTGVVSFFACGIGLQVGGAAHWLGWGMLFGFVGMAIGVVLRGIAEHQEDKQHGAT